MSAFTLRRSTLRSADTLRQSFTVTLFPDRRGWIIGYVENGHVEHVENGTVVWTDRSWVTHFDPPDIPERDR